LNKIDLRQSKAEILDEKIFHSRRQVCHLLWLKDQLVIEPMHHLAIAESGELLFHFDCELFRL
jgi:hypothetical protein